MIEEVLKHLKSDVDKKTKFNLIKEIIICYCVQENHVFNCYRNLKHLELEISELLNDNLETEFIQKCLKIIETELEILHVRMRIAQSLDDVGEKEKSDFQLNWTDSKTDIVELIYSVKDSIGNGKVSIKRITECFEHFFNVKIGNVYDIINDISMRKVNRTRYLNKITDNFQKVLELMDS